MLCLKDGHKMKFSRFAQQYFCPYCQCQTNHPIDYIKAKRREELRIKNSIVHKYDKENNS